MSAPLVAAADARLAAMRRNLQKTLHMRVDNTAQRIFADTTFLEDSNVIPLRAALIGQIVLSAQQLLVSHYTDQLSQKIGLASVPRMPASVYERPGVDKVTEYSRPFYTSLQLIRGGKSDDEALDGGSKRLRVMSATDLQMAKVRAARIALKAKGRKTFKRVTTSGKPCELCELASDQIYYTDQLMPIHPGCSCDVEADESGELPDEPDDSDTLAVREHGEIGPLLTWAADSFKGPDDLPNPPEIVAAPTGGQERGPGIPASIYARARAHLDAINLQIARHAS